MSTSIGYMELQQPYIGNYARADNTLYDYTPNTYIGSNYITMNYNIPRNNNNNGPEVMPQFNLYPNDHRPSGYIRTDPYDQYIGPPSGRQNYRSSRKNVRIIKVLVYIKVDKPASTKLEEYIHEHHDEFSECMILEMIPVLDSSKYSFDSYPLVEGYFENQLLFHSSGFNSTKQMLADLHYVVANISQVSFHKDPEEQAIRIKRALYTREEFINDEYDRSEISELQAVIRKKEEEKKEMELVLERLEFINKTLIEAEDPEPAPGESKELCIVCLAACRDHIFLPCAHMACCTTCANYVIHDTKKCPTCRAEVTSIKKIFIA